MKERALFLTILLFFQLTLSLTVGLLPSEPLRHAAMLGVMLLPLLLWKRAPKGTKRLRFIPPKNALPLLLLLPAFILLVASVSIGWGKLAALIGIPLHGAEPVKPLSLAILLDAAVPAIGEEIFARGAVYSVLRPHGRRTAAFGSALIFALMHASLAQLPYALLAGLLLAMLYEASGGLLMPIVVHFCSNLFSLLLLFGAPPLPLLIALAVLAVIGATVLILWARPASLPTEGEIEGDNIGALILSPLLLWIGAILFFMLF